MNDKSLAELKSMAYDMIRNIEGLQFNLRKINEEIVKKEREPKEEKK
jgi:hypothetical protein